MTLKELIVSLCSLMSVSGCESRSEKELCDLIGPAFDEHRSDALGNHLFIKRCGRANAPCILVDTHFDEIGLMVSDIHEGGFLSVVNIGGVDTRILSSAEVTVYGKEPIYGVFVHKPERFRSQESRENLPSLDELRIDTGYTKEELEEICPIGTPVGFRPVYRELLHDGLCGKAFDDKACGACAVYGIDGAWKKDLAGDVYFLFSAFEETGSAGAKVAGFGIRPDYALVADVTHATVPDTEDVTLSPFGGGVAIAYASVTDRRLTRMAIQACRSAGVPFSLDSCAGSTGTNANALSVVAEGIPTVLMSVPVKNMHSPSEVLCMEDAYALSNAIKAFICSKEIAEVFAK